MYWIPSHQSTTYQTDFKKWVFKFSNHLSNVSTKPKLWIDIGGNKGVATDEIEKNISPSDKIWVFEPSPDSFTCLCEKYKNNTNIVVWNLALSDYIGNRPFFVDETNPCAAHNFLEKSLLGHNINNFKKINCTVVTLDSLVVPTNYTVPFVKIDAECQDIKILQGANNFINQHRPYILFEFSGMITSEAFSITPPDFYNFFKNHNYHLRSIVKGHDEKYIYSHYKIKTPELQDLLAVPNETPLKD